MNTKAKKQAEKIIESLSLEQKCALLSGGGEFETRSLPQKGIPAMVLSDGPNGVRRQAGASDHLGLNPSLPATCFPTAVTVANSWDPALGEAIGRAMGEEAAAQEVSVLLGPGLNTKRSPLCGRNFEYFSEDPYLSGKLAASYVRGIQSTGIAACPKHFAVNSQELRRMASDSVLDERTLRELYLTNFEIVVKEAAPRAIMTSYNMVNGTYANENEHLLSDILRKEWGFQGMVVTDWGGSNDHALGVKRGSTLEMPAPGGGSVRELLRALESGKITKEDIDARLAELLPLVLETNEVIQKSPRTFDAEAHHRLARQAAEEGMVLLKNEDRILPLASGTKVALIGDFAETPRYQGAGSSAVNAIKVDTFLQVIRGEGGWECSGLAAGAGETKRRPAALAGKSVSEPLQEGEKPGRQAVSVGKTAGGGPQLVGYAPGFDRFGAEDETKRRAALELAGKADVVLLFLGLDEIRESEGLDRQDMKLAANQTDLLADIREVNENVVVILSAGSPVETPWLPYCKGLLYTALSGQAGAGALLDVLNGKANPSGKLAETWARAYRDVPVQEHFGGPGRTVQYREGLYTGYRYYQTAGAPAAFPFGFGLSYTTYAYKDLKADSRQISLTVTNTGSRSGTEIVQVYLSLPGAQVFRPAQELKGFARVSLRAGESRRVTIPLDGFAFRYWDVSSGRWEIEGGTYEIRVGASCEDIRLTGSVRLAGTVSGNPYEGLALPHYESGQIRAVPDEEWSALLGRPLPEEHTQIDRTMTLGEIGCARAPIGWIAGSVLNRLLENSKKKGKPDLNLIFIHNMPLRALAKMTGGMVSMEMVDGLVMELKGFWVIGLIRTLVQFVRNRTQNAQLEERLKE